MKIFGICLALFVLSSGYSQEDKNDWRLYKPNTNELSVDSPTVSVGDVPIRDKGTIRYIQEERISVLDEYLRTHPFKMEGYRIQVVFGSRSEVSVARSKLLSRWSYSAYETYLPPNFRLRVGDFMNRFQAEKALRKLKSKFPNAYIVRDKINTPRQFR